MADKYTRRDIDSTLVRITAIADHAFQLQEWESGHYQLDTADNRHASPKLLADPFLSWLSAFERGLTYGKEISR